MSRQAGCGHTEALNRARTARMYLDVSEVASAEERIGASNVAAGNAVLAAIAAADAICCMRLGKRHRGQDHLGAAALLKSVQPGGATYAKDLQAVLTVKDPSHYGDSFVSDTKLKSTLRAATRLVQAAEALLPRGQSS